MGGPSKTKGRPSFEGRPFHCRTAVRPTTRRLLGDLVSGDPGRGFHTRMRTMRHWVTSFQLLNRTFNMGPIFRFANPFIEAQASVTPRATASSSRPARRRSSVTVRGSLSRASIVAR